MVGGTRESIEVLHSFDKAYIDANIDTFLKELGSNIRFEDNIWICDKTNKKPSTKSDSKISYKNIPEQYIDYIKYYVILSNQKFSTKKTNVNNISYFCRYLESHESLLPLFIVNQTTIERYRRYVDTLNIAKSSKVKRLQVISDFFWKLDGWEGIPKNNPVNKRVHLYKRKKSDNETKTKYIPDSVTKELDKIFHTSEVPIHFRLYYWFIRLFPSRCSEISSLKIDCIKQLGDSYILFKSEEKSSNDIGESNLLSIYIKYEGMGKYLVDLYHEQKKISENLQDKVDQEYKGSLFLYNPIFIKNNKIVKQKRICLVIGRKFNKYMQRLCNEKNLIKGLDNGINITTHAFRHNGITDRLYDGFSSTAIRDITGQKSDGEVIGTYHHRNKNEIEKLQRKAMSKSFYNNETNAYERLNNQHAINHIHSDVSLSSSKVMFRGRIINLEENKEKRILENKRAYQISYSDKCIGICTEIASCSNGIFNCFKCSDFAPDSNELGFFKEQVKYWENKIEYFQLRGNQYQKQHAIEVKVLFEIIVRRIEEINKQNDVGD